MSLLNEKSPPGKWGKWIEHRKKENPDQDPAIWFAIAWKKYNQGKDYEPKRGKGHGKIEKKRRAKPNKTKKKQKTPITKRKKKKINESLFSLVMLKQILMESECAVNNASGGNVAGLDNNPPVNKKKKSRIFRRKYEDDKTK